MRRIKQWRAAAFFLTVCLFFALSGILYTSEQQNAIIHVSTDNGNMLYPCGFPVGIYLRTEGVMVIGTAHIADENGHMSEPAAGTILSGDYILSINGESVDSKEDFRETLNRHGANPVTLVIERNLEKIEISIQAVRCSNGEYRLGIWVKDDIQGIGTMTYLTADGRFGALGHPISDVDTGKMVHARNGGLYQAQIKMIIKGTNGTPGSFSGIICYDHSTCYGDITDNSECGIFGNADLRQFPQLEMIAPCPAGTKAETTCGSAVLRCTIGGETKDYGISILNLNAGTKSDKGFLFEVTDQELIDKTGGIIQGMSGSPILQNGKLIGAVTHVFVNNSTKGYGIFIEDMLKQQNIN